jgi:hypothetical protein
MRAQRPEHALTPSTEWRSTGTPRMMTIPRPSWISSRTREIGVEGRVAAMLGADLGEGETGLGLPHLLRLYFQEICRHATLRYVGSNGN